jgi:hypothetical protein
LSEHLSDMLPESFEGRDELLKKFSTPEGLAKGYVEAEKFRGQSIRIPSGTPSEEDFKRVMEKLGAPSDSSQYSLPEGYEEDLSYMRQAGHDARLTPTQYDILMQKAKALVDERRAGDSKIEFGVSNDDRTNAQRAFQSLSPEAQERVNPNDPATVELLAKLGSSMQNPRGPQVSAPGESLNPQFEPKRQAEKVRAILASPAYKDSFHPEHERAAIEYRKEMTMLMDQGRSESVV